MKSNAECCYFFFYFFFPFGKICIYRTKCYTSDVGKQVISCCVVDDASHRSYAAHDADDGKHDDNQPVQPEDCRLPGRLEHDLVEEHGQHKVEGRVPKSPDERDDVAEKWKHRRKERRDRYVQGPKYEPRHHVPQTELPLSYICQFSLKHFKYRLHVHLRHGTINSS